MTDSQKRVVKRFSSVINVTYFSFWGRRPLTPLGDFRPSEPLTQLNTSQTIKSQKTPALSYLSQKIRVLKRNLETARMAGAHIASSVDHRCRTCCWLLCWLAEWRLQNIINHTWEQHHRAVTALRPPRANVNTASLVFSLRALNYSLPRLPTCI